jgi:multicomponent Na+:H+ antiporter subunit B
MKLLPLFIVIITGALLIWAGQDMPAFGDPDAPTNHHVADWYIENSEEDIAMENLVSTILADYRGYDTLGETTVIFTGGVSVILLLRRRQQ